MRQLTRSWPALSALGAALLFGAVGAGAIGGAPVVGAIWLSLAAAQAVFGIQSLRAGRVPSPALTLILFLLPLLLWAALIMLGPVLGLEGAPTHSHAGADGAAGATGATGAGGAPAASLQLPADAVLLPLIPLLTASALSAGVAVHSACSLRRRALTIRSADAAAIEPPAGGRFVVGLLIGAVALSALVTPGLAATDAGRLAVPHGEHTSSAPQ